MSKSKPKSTTRGVYYRDDGVPRWEAKIRWTDKHHGPQYLPTKRWPVDPKALKNEPGHIVRARLDAEAWASQQWQSLATFDKPLAKRAAGWTLEGLMESYLEDLKAGTIKRKGDTDKNVLNMFLGKGRGNNKDGFKDIAQRQVTALTYEHFVGPDPKSFQSRLKDSHGNKAPDGSVRRALNVVRSVFKYGQNTLLIDMDNPLASIKGLNGDDARDRTISDDEWKKILHEMAGCEQGTRDAIGMGRWTAARRGEVVKLDWSDINLKDRTALLRDTKSRGDKKVDRTIGLTEKAWEIIVHRGLGPEATIEGAEAKLVAAKLSGPVFRNDKGARLRADTLTQAWSRACKKAGIDDARVHDLRHTRITEIGKFLPAAEAARVSGHTDLATFFRYFNPDPSETRRKIDAFERGLQAGDDSNDLVHRLAALSDAEFAAILSATIQYKAQKSAGK